MWKAKKAKKVRKVINHHKVINHAILRFTIFYGSQYYGFDL